MGVFQRILFVLGIRQPLSPAAIEVMKTLYSMEKAIDALPQTQETKAVKAGCKKHHQALDDLRKYHNKKMPPDNTVFGGPGTKPGGDG